MLTPTERWERAYKIRLLVAIELLADRMQGVALALASSPAFAERMGGTGWRIVYLGGLTGA